MAVEIVSRLKMTNHESEGLLLTPITPESKVLDTYNRWWFPEPHPDLLPGIGLHPQTPYVIRNGQVVRVTVDEWIEEEQKALDSCCWTASLIETGEVVGNLSARRVNFPACELAYLIGPEYQNRGLGTLMVATALALLSKCRFERVKAEVDLRNPKSARVLVKNGFNLLRKDNESEYYEVNLLA